MTINLANPDYGFLQSLSQRRGKVLSRGYEEGAARRLTSMGLCTLGYTVQDGEIHETSRLTPRGVSRVEEIKRAKRPAWMINLTSFINSIVYH